MRHKLTIEAPKNHFLDNVIEGFGSKSDVVDYCRFITSKDNKIDSEFTVLIVHNGKKNVIETLTKILAMRGCDKYIIAENPAIAEYGGFCNPPPIKMTIEYETEKPRKIIIHEDGHVEIQQ